jgi:drug/metabolite transporter (DMT)-like permease
VNQAVAIRAGSDPWRGLRSHPLTCGASGAALLGFSGIFFRLAAVGPATGAFWRCGLGLAFLIALASREGVAGLVRPNLWGMLGGVLMGLDFVLWQQSVHDLGAGLATVIANSQLVTIVLIDCLLFRNRPSPRGVIGIGCVLVGLVLISGVLTNSGYGPDPAAGTALGFTAGICAGVFIVILRHANTGLERPATPLAWATLSAAATALVAAGATEDFRLQIGASALLWLALLALACQAVGWLLVSIPLRVISPTKTAILFVVQALVALLAGRVILSEHPTPLQLAGTVLALIGAGVVNIAELGADHDGARIAGVEEPVLHEAAFPIERCPRAAVNEE